jgi:hypothetical protein
VLSHGPLSLLGLKAEVSRGGLMSWIFPTWFSVEFDGQVYAPVSVKDYLRADGQPSNIVEWKTECPRCGETFTFEQGRKFRSPRRFCDNCKAPGRTVKDMRRQLRAQINGSSP